MPGKSFSISSGFETERGKIATPKASPERRKIMSLFLGKKCAFGSSTVPLATINVTAMSNSPATRDGQHGPNILSVKGESGRPERHRGQDCSRHHKQKQSHRVQ